MRLRRGPFIVGAAAVGAVMAAVLVPSAPSAPRGMALRPASSAFGTTGSTGTTGAHATTVTGGVARGTSGPATTKTAAQALRAGCSSSRVAVAYQPDGVLMVPQPPTAPVPCLVPTGFATMETHIGVTNDGALVYEPASLPDGLLGSWYLPSSPGPHPWSPLSPAGIVVSGNQGATWSFVRPAGALGAGNDTGFYVDPVTGRLFMDWLAALGPSGGQVPPQDQTDVPAPSDGKAIMLESPDDGTSWSETSIPGIVDPENARFTSAPPAPGQATAAGGYPDVTYWCGNQNVGITWPAIADRQCYRSLDGGVSWEFRSVLFANVVPASPECSGPPFDSALDGNYPEGAPDGSLYVMVACAELTSANHFGAVYLARSTDEAATWPVLEQPAAGSGGTAYVRLPVPAGASDPELRVTTVGGRTVLVLAYETVGAHGPQVLMKSTEVPAYTSSGALSSPLAWSAPATLTVGGLSSIDPWALSVRGSELALSYLAGSPAVSGTDYNGYLTMVGDVEDPSVVWSAMVNAPSAPLSRSAPPFGKDDFIGAAIGPDGTPWASYFSPCSADPNAATDPACEGAYVDGKPVNSAVQGGNDRGMVASLLLPQPP